MVGLAARRPVLVPLAADRRGEFGPTPADDRRVEGDENRPAGRRTHLQLVFDDDVYRTYRDRLQGPAQ